MPAKAGIQVIQTALLPAHASSPSPCLQSGRERIFSLTSAKPKDTEKRSVVSRFSTVATGYACNPDGGFEERRSKDNKLIRSEDRRLPFR